MTVGRTAASGVSELTATERRALKKAAWRLLPLLTIAYLFNYFDRTVVGFAALTMNRDIGLTSSQFGFGAGLLFIAYSKSRATWFSTASARGGGSRAS